jgi:hypothetical protein
MDKKFNLFVLIVLLLTLSIGSFGLSQDVKRDRPLQLQGKFITNDSEAYFTFVGDSLFIDCAGSGCGIHAMRLKYTKGYTECDAEETITDPETGKTFKEVHHLAFPRLDTRKISVVWEYETTDTIIRVFP